MKKRIKYILIIGVSIFGMLSCRSDVKNDCDDIHNATCRKFKDVTNQTIGDYTPPTAGTGLIFSHVAISGMTVSWGAATDDTILQEKLSYKLVYSTENNVGTIEEAEAKGTVAMDWTENTLTRDVTDLGFNVTYYFNVLVKDTNGNKTAYTTESQKTADAPAVGTDLVFSDVTPRSMTVTWGAATDQETTQEKLQYKLVYSASENISSAADAEANGTTAMDWTAATLTKTITSLTPESTYWFAVLVKDELENVSIYTPKSQATHFETLISTGFYHTCGLFNGSAKCWGYNFGGALGDGTTTDSLTPVQVVGLTSGVTAISANNVVPPSWDLRSIGNPFSCAIVSGTAKCWGANSVGQLGNDSTTSSADPVAVSTLSSEVTSLSAGLVHTCAVHDGAAKCWGYNHEGQLGDNTTVNQRVPVGVLTLSSGVTMISAGYYHTCAIKDGAAKCWGHNSDGQLGDGTQIDSLIPVDVTGMETSVTAISTGSQHTCAIKSGAAKCWGDNSIGQLGDGSRSGSTTPVDVVGMSSGVTAITAGVTHTCAVQNGAVKCWGANSRGQLGDNTTSSHPTPVAVSGLDSGATSISAGLDATCGVQNSIAKCWGLNDYGQLGDGTTTDRHIPVIVSLTR